MNITLLLGALACLAYAAAMIPVLKAWKTKTQPDRPTLLAFGSVGLLLHTLFLHDTLFSPQGVDFGLGTMMSILGWVEALLLNVLLLYRPISSLALGAYPLSIFGVLMSWIGPHDFVPYDHYGVGMLSHILISIIAYCVIMLAVAQAVLLFSMDYLLKHKHPGAALVKLLPPLQTMETVLFEMVAIGLGLLTISILSGAIYVENLLAQHLVHKTVFTIAAWLIFATLLAGRHFYGWRGRMAIRWTLAGSFLLLLGFLGTQIVLQLILHRPPVG
ncbi:MAG TPA: cytochrome c biogenesis protein CcsA [Pseudomonadales bacterium]|nr:cytochrome c biogenesis protein CcsA [Pseudomonadales bacterium]